jgi:hypothetical protein
MSAVTKMPRGYLLIPFLNVVHSQNVTARHEPSTAGVRHRVTGGIEASCIGDYSPAERGRSTGHDEVVSKGCLLSSWTRAMTSADSNHVSAGLIGQLGVTTALYPVERHAMRPPAVT